MEREGMEGARGPTVEDDRSGKKELITQHMGLRRMDTAVRMCKEKIIPIFPCYFITLFPINLYNCLTN